MKATRKIEARAQKLETPCRRSYYNSTTLHRSKRHLLCLIDSKYYVVVHVLDDCNPSGMSTKVLIYLLFLHIFV